MLERDFSQNLGGLCKHHVDETRPVLIAGTTYRTFFRMITEPGKEKIVRYAGKDIAILKTENIGKINCIE